jgi:predicted SAM-dependent methyltransferase
MTPLKPGQNILECGGGDNPKFRPNMDSRQSPSVDIVHDLNKPFPILDNTYDGVFSMYAIEHLSWRKVKDFVKEMHRVVKPGGRVIVITANILEQCRLITKLPELLDTNSAMLWGDQNYEGKDWIANAHHCGFSPASASKMFKEAGFDSVMIESLPACNTDMLIEATKPIPANLNANSAAALWTPQERKKAFDFKYFDGGRGEVGGYLREGYWDYPIHWTTFNHVKDRKPESVLEIGCARGYILKRLEDAGIRTMGLEVSDACLGMRATDCVKQWDITQFPWPVPDKAFDLCFSISTLEHIPENKVPLLAKELERVSARGLHGIDTGRNDDGSDKTHCLLRDVGWWRERLPSSQEVLCKELLENGPPELPRGDGCVKLNLGCFLTMFHNGWVNIDIQDLTQFASLHNYVFRRLDITKGFPYDDSCVDFVYACHVLEHLSFRQGEKLFKDLRRIMKTGSVLRLIVPDAKGLMLEYLNGSLGKFDSINEACAAAKSQAEKLHSLLAFGHSSLYDAETVVKILVETGFKAQQMSFRRSLSPQILKETLDLLPDISFFVDAVV